MIERPLIFTGESIPAILEGRQTQTRRVPVERYRKWKVGDRIWVRETFAYFPDDTHIIYKSREGQDFEKLGIDLNGCWHSPIFLPKRAAIIWLTVTGLREERVQDISEEDAIAEGAQYHKYTEEENPDPLAGVDGYWFFESRLKVHLAFGCARAAFADYWDSLNAKRGICKTCKGYEKVPGWAGSLSDNSLTKTVEDCPDCNGPTGYGWAENPTVKVIEFERL